MLDVFASFLFLDELNFLFLYPDLDLSALGYPFSIVLLSLVFDWLI